MDIMKSIIGEPGTIGIVLPAGFRVNPPQGLDNDVAEKVGKWTWVSFNDLSRTIINTARSQGEENAGFPTLPLEILERFGFLMGDGHCLEDMNLTGEKRYSYLVVDSRDNSVTAKNCFIGTSKVPLNNYDLFVPAGWAKTVLWLVKEGVISVDKRFIQASSPNLVGHRRDGSWHLLTKDVTRLGPDSWKLSHVVPPSS